MISSMRNLKIIVANHGPCIKSLYVAPAKLDL